MNLISVDPGPTQSAVIGWDGQRAQNPRIIPNSDLRIWLLNSAPHVPLAVEMIQCFGMPVGAEVFETVLFIGRLQEIWIQKGLPFRLVYRRDVKMHLCGNMRAKDPNIRQALIDKLGIVGTKKTPGPLFGISSHMWAALGVAVTASELAAKPASP